MNAGVQFTFSFLFERIPAHGMVLLTFRVGLYFAFSGMIITINVSKTLIISLERL